MKAIALAVSLVMILTILAGCSGNGKSSSSSNSSSSTKGKTELTFWTLFAGGDGEFMQAMIDEYNKSQSDFAINNVVLEWGEYYTKLVTGVSSGNGPDIGISHTSKLPELMDEGVVTSLDTEADAIKLDWGSYNATALDATIHDGQHYAIPIDTHAFIMYYNKKLLRDAGLLDSNDTPKISDGADGFVSFLTELKGKLPADVSPYSLSNTGEPYRLWWALYHQLGGNDVISNDGTKAEIDKEKAVQAAAYIKDLFDKGFIKPNDPDFYKTFQTQQAAIMTTGVWATGTWEGTEGLEFGAMQLPAIFGNHKTWGDSHTLILPVTKSNDAKKRQGALQFMDWIGEHGYMWAKAGHIPAKDKIVETTEFKALDYRGDYFEAASNTVHAKTSTKTWAKNDLLNKYLDEIWTGKATPEQGIDTIEKEINLLLSK
jgi:multiple sugar transport system substrate-binding protein